MNTEVNVGDQVVPAARPRGWWSRNWKWFVPIALFVSLLVCAGVVFAALSRHKWSEPYLKALEKVQATPQVAAKLGEPITGVFWPPPSGEVQVDDGGGEAHLAFSVLGPNGKADVQTQARRIAGTWGLSLLVVGFPDGQRLKIDLGAESGMEEAPQWKPSPAAGEKKADQNKSGEKKPDEKKSDEKKSDDAPAPVMEFQIPEP